MTHRQRIRVAAIASGAFFLILFAFVVFGEALLGLFGIGLDAFKVAGGLLLITTALRMLYPERSQGPDEDAAPAVERSPASVAIVPLTIPILAGPGAITTVLVETHDHQGWLVHDLKMGLAVLVVTVVIFAMFRMAAAAERAFRPSTVAILNQVMALVIASIGAEFILEGLAATLG